MTTAISALSTKTAVQGNGASDVFKQIQALQKQEMQITKQLAELEKSLAGKPPDQATFNLMMALSKQIAAIKQEIKALEQSSLQKRAEQGHGTAVKPSEKAASGTEAANAVPSPAATHGVTTIDESTAPKPSTVNVGTIIDTTA